MPRAKKENVPVLPLSKKCISILADEYMELQNIEMTTPDDNVKKIAKHKRELIIDLLQGYERQ